MADEHSTRDRIRALVRDVLEKAAPAEELPEGAAPPPARTGVEAKTQHPSPGEAEAATPPRARIHSTVVEPGAATVEREFTHDESSKTVITEADVRGLPEGARLRVAEGARLTPLAADIVRERRVELVRRQPRRGPRAERIIAVGADHGGYPLKEELKDLPRRTRPPRPRLRHALDRRRRLPRLRARRRPRRLRGRGRPRHLHRRRRRRLRHDRQQSARRPRRRLLLRQGRRQQPRTQRRQRPHAGERHDQFQEMRDIVAAWLSTEITEERHKKRVAKIDAVERQYR